MDCIIEICGLLLNSYALVSRDLSAPQLTISLRRPFQEKQTLKQYLYFLKLNFSSCQLTIDLFVVVFLVE